jgi:diadenylate cyclase
MDSVSELLSGIVENADAVALFSPTGSLYERFTDQEIDAIVIGTENTVDADVFVEIPLDFAEIEDLMTFGIGAAIGDGYVDEGDVVVCATSVFDEEIDTVSRVRATNSIHSSLYDLFVNSRAEPSVIRSVLEVAIDLGKKGQKGKPVGALFIVGDAGNVMNKSRPLSYNPFEKSHVHVGDPIVNVMLKEFSRLDGAFVISDSGKIVSAYRYLEPDAKGIDIPKGLGARHMAGGAITRDTNTTSIVLSESDGLVRAFKGGTLVLEIDPEEY